MMKQIVDRRKLIAGTVGAAASLMLPWGAARSAAKASDELAWIPAWKLQEMFRRRSLSPLEYARFLVRRIEDHKALGAFITVDGDYLIDQARIASEVSGRDLPLLHGLPVSAKDLLYTKGLRTTMGSRIFAGQVPDRDAVVIERVRAAGGILFAKTNTPEFGKATRTVNLVADEARNPWDTKRTSGGSSGGAAVAAAAGLGPLAIGTDGGGSIRLPAAFNGVFGLKTSRGLIANGAGPYASHTSAIGPLTRDVRDAAMLLQATAGFDPRDRFSVRYPTADYLGELDKGVRGLRMAWSPDWGRVVPDEPDIIPICHEAARTFRRLGAVYSEPAIRIEDPLDPLERQPEFSAAEVEKRVRAQAPDNVDSMTWLSRLSADQRALLSDDVRNLAGYLDFEEYVAHIPASARQRAADRLDDLFGRYDLLLSPTIARRAFLIDGEPSRPLHYIAYTTIFNLSGHCAASVPAGFYKGMPVGLQIVGQPGQEVLVLRAARALERARPWAQRHPYA